MCGLFSVTGSAMLTGGSAVLTHPLKIAFILYPGSALPRGPSSADHSRRSRPSIHLSQASTTPQHLMAIPRRCRYHASLSHTLSDSGLDSGLWYRMSGVLGVVAAHIGCFVHSWCTALVVRDVLYDISNTSTSLFWSSIITEWREQLRRYSVL